MTVPGINNRLTQRTSFRGNTIAKKRSRVTDNVASTDPNRKVSVNPYDTGMIATNICSYKG